jgi:hypothetical protein
MSIRNWTSIGLDWWRDVNKGILTHADTLLQQYEASRTIPGSSFFRLLKRVQVQLKREERSIVPKLPESLKVVFATHHEDLHCCAGSDVNAKAKWLREVMTHIILGEEYVWSALTATETPKAEGVLSSK